MRKFTIKQHQQGIAQLVAPEWSKHSDLSKMSDKERSKWLLKFIHKIEPHPQFSVEPPKGQRDEKSLAAKLRQLGAGDICYVVASDDPEYDDTLQPLNTITSEQLFDFGHGTFLSCIPGKLALYRSSWPHRHLIVHRAKD